MDGFARMNKLTIADIIEILGGSTQLSERLAQRGVYVTRDAVSKWKHVGKIPQRYWPHLIDLGADLRPITSDDLVAAHTKKPE